MTYLVYLDPKASVQAKIINYSTLRVPVADDINADNYMLNQEGNNKWAFVRRNEDEDLDELNQRIKFKEFYTTSNQRPSNPYRNCIRNPNGNLKRGTAESVLTRC
jgi:hypothetical protein